MTCMEAAAGSRSGTAGRVVSFDPVLTSGDRRTAHFRAHERRHLELDALLWRAADSEPVAAKVLNLGLGGAGLAFTAQLRQEDRLTVTLLSPSLLDPLIANARVAWVHAPGGSPLSYAGLAFEALERSTLLTLFQLISTLTL
jgi:hypothetical protein